VSAQHDRGLKAVARVRDVRERDSRLGLQQALREEQTLQDRLTTLQEQMRVTAAFDSGDMRDYVAARTALESLRVAASELQQEVDSAAVLTATARSHWLYDKTRLAAVEGLLERRADERRVEAATKEAHELDDVAGRLWLRENTEKQIKQRKESA
jgi:flagellar protein FliJ